MKTILTLCLKDITTVFREKSTIFWVLGFPIVIGILFGLIFKGTQKVSNINIAILDNDQSAKSKKLIAELEKNSAFKVISNLDKKQIDPKLKTGRISAYAIIKKDFGKNDLLFHPSNKTYLKICASPNSSMQANLLKGALTQAKMKTQFSAMQNSKDFDKMLADIKSDLAKDNEMSADYKKELINFLNKTSEFLKIEKPAEQKNSLDFNMQDLPIEVINFKKGKSPASSFEVTFPQGMMWIFIGCVTCFAATFADEKNGGIFARLRVAPISYAQILLAKMLACFSCCVVVSGVMILLGKFIFGVSISNIFAMLIALCATGFCFSGLMVLVTNFGKTSQAVSGAATGIQMFFAMIGGVMVPLVFMPGWLKSLSVVSPARWGIIACEGAIWRGYSLSEMILPAGILVGIGLAFALIGIGLGKPGK